MPEEPKDTTRPMTLAEWLTWRRKELEAQLAQAKSDLATAQRMCDAVDGALQENRRVLDLVNRPAVVPAPAGASE